MTSWMPYWPICEFVPVAARRIALESAVLGYWRLVARIAILIGTGKRVAFVDAKQQRNDHIYKLAILMRV